MLREEVKKWREKTTKERTLQVGRCLTGGFKTEHTTFDSKGIAVPFRYYFAQRGGGDCRLALRRCRSGKQK